MGAAGRRLEPLPTFAPGDRVRYTADHLRSCGMGLGAEGLSRWTVVGCDCGLCTAPDCAHVAVDEPSQFGKAQRRHIHRGALQRVGELRGDRIPQGGFLKIHQ